MIRKIQFALICIYFLVLFYYGLFIKIFINLNIISYLKYIPEILICTVCLLTIPNFKYKRKSFWDLIIILCFFVISIISLNKLTNALALMLFIRDVMIPILVFFIIKNSYFKNTYYTKLKHFFVVFMYTFLIVSAPFGLLEHIKGWEWTSFFFTGKVFYGVDNISSISIKTANGIFRAIGLVGDTAKYGIYSVIAFLMIYLLSDKNNVKIIFPYLMAVINSYLSTNKTSLITLLIILIFFLISKVKIKEKKAIAFLVLFLICLTFILNINIFPSMIERFQYWQSYIKINLSNILISTNVYNFFASNDFNSVMDNSYFFGMQAFGTVFYICFLFYIYKTTKQMPLFFYCFLIIGLTTNVFSGRSFFGIFLLITGLFANQIHHKEQIKK